MEEEEASSKQNLTKREVEGGLGLSMLIDSQNNQYILTKPRDSTIPRADHHFIKASCRLQWGWPVRLSCVSCLSLDASLPATRGPTGTLRYVLSKASLVFS